MIKDFHPNSSPTSASPGPVTAFPKPSSHVSDLPAMILVIVVLLNLCSLSNPGKLSNYLHQDSSSKRTSPDHETNTSAQATSEDVVRVLLNFCSQEIDAERKHTNAKIAAERELTNTKIIKVMKSLDDKFDAVTNVINQYNPILVDLDLKIETVGTYHEQLIYKLKSGLQDALANIEKDMKTVWSDLNQLQPPQMATYQLVCKQVV